MGSIVIAGLGIRGSEQVTVEVERCLRSADLVFHSVAHRKTEEWIRSIAASTYNVDQLYVDGRPRLEAYHAMAQMIVENASAGGDVAFVVYGHPCVLHTGVQLTLRAGRARSIPIRILPGVSSVDVLLAHQGIDFGFGGLHVLEATDLLLYGRTPQTDGHVVILQVGVTGPRLHRADGHHGAHVGHLIERLGSFYPPDHPALHFRLASRVDGPDLIDWSTIQRLHLQRWSNPSSLYLPPARPSQLDPVYAGRFEADPSL